MPAGYNVKVRIWQINYEDDNAVGGAVISGTSLGIYPGIFDAIPQQQLLLQQGLEVDRTFNLTLVPGTLAIKERDEIEIYEPEDHAYYGDRFRIRGITYSRMNKRDPRNYMMLMLSRSEYAHERQ